MLASAGLDNTLGTVSANTLNVDTRGAALINAQGTLAGATTVNLQSGALRNDAGLIQSGGAMAIDTVSQGLEQPDAAGYANRLGGIASGGTLTIDAGALDNRGGQTLSAGDLRIHAGTASGLLSVNAGRDIDIASGRSTTATISGNQSSKKGPAQHHHQEPGASSFLCCQGI